MNESSMDTRELLNYLDKDTINELVRMIDFAWKYCPTCNHTWSYFVNELVMNGIPEECPTCAAKRDKSTIEIELSFVLKHQERIRVEILGMGAVGLEKYYGHILAEMMVLEGELREELNKQ